MTVDHLPLIWSCQNLESIPMSLTACFKVGPLTEALHVSCLAQLGEEKGMVQHSIVGRPDQDKEAHIVYQKLETLGRHVVRRRRMWGGVGNMRSGVRDDQLRPIVDVVEVGDSKLGDELTPVIIPPLEVDPFVTVAAVSSSINHLQPWSTCIGSTSRGGAWGLYMWLSASPIHGGVHEKDKRRNTDSQCQCYEWRAGAIRFASPARSEVGRMLPSTSWGWGVVKEGETALLHPVLDALVSMYSLWTTGDLHRIWICWEVFNPGGMGMVECPWKYDMISASSVGTQLSSQISDSIAVESVGSDGFGTSISSDER
ncbi:uncharacterized protein EI90DRAFT_3019934 [Cantharellus anzutake]|uniref:uncharacterized protein n=1 Tax=Cantharellus anzutake TaxID=1750568 RepID=UPI001902C93A|nr:uncharacterized protein EI90DRAFT_3019934 [Cantharellus anzutake]KAF8322942.1 hypothetical protein EI90DRAFT_3019934 [Cantharellus anzutake]